MGDDFFMDFSFLGRAVARAPISRFFRLSVRPSICHSQLPERFREQPLVLKQSRAHLVLPDDRLSSPTLRFFSLAEQCHTQKFYLRCFKLDFDAVKSKFGLLIKFVQFVQFVLFVQFVQCIQFVQFAEQCHTQNFYLRCFKLDFDAVKRKFGLFIEQIKKTTSI